MIKNAVLSELRLGVIQEFQIEERLRLMGVPSFQIKELKREILETYRKEHPCY